MMHLQWFQSERDAEKRSLPRAATKWLIHTFESLSSSIERSRLQDARHLSGRDELTLPVLVWRLLLGDVCGTPERARVDAIGIDLQHRVVELARGRCCSIQAVEVAKVLP